MQDWLVGHIDIFGVPVQNWMLLVALGLAAYLATLVLAHRGEGAH